MVEHCDIVIGLSFGDEGKGRTTEMFARNNRATKSVVKFSGGQQTAHNVVNGSFHHTYRQFGSATHLEIPTIFSRFMLVDPIFLFEEGDALFFKTGFNPFPDLQISENCLMITPIHIWVNRVKETARGIFRHGSCGLGVGETRKYSLQHAEGFEPKMGDLTPSGLTRLEKKLEKLIRYAEDEVKTKYDGQPLQELMEIYKSIVSEGALNIVPDSKITDFISEGYHVFEGTQGVLLDETLGFLPHNTWTSTVPQNALLLLSEAGREGKVTGITRTYGTRHGAGPFPSEFVPGLNLPWVPSDEVLEKTLPELHNETGDYTGGWRRGLLDFSLLEYSLRAAKQIDQIMVTHLDLVTPNWKFVVGYDNWKYIPTDFYGKDLKAKEEHTATLFKLSLENAHVSSVNTAEELVAVIENNLNTPVAFTASNMKAGFETAR